MSCKDAMIPKDQVLKAHPSDVAGDVLGILDKEIKRYAIVIDDNGQFLGRFGSSTVLKKILPTVTTMEGALNHLNFVSSGEPLFANDLKTIKTQPVGEVMRSDLESVQPDTPAIEGMRLLIKYGSPLAVIEPKTKEFLGIITEQSVLKRLNELAE